MTTTSSPSQLFVMQNDDRFSVAAVCDVFVMQNDDKFSVAAVWHIDDTESDVHEQSVLH